ncbi:MAG: hypothetical protein ACI81R_000353 [Bradymonadia bacterium]|jgi:hypothetical protein
MNIKLTTSLALAALLALPAAAQAQRHGGNHGGSGYLDQDGHGGHGNTHSQVTPRHVDRAEARVRELSRDVRRLSSAAYGYEDASLDHALAVAGGSLDRAARSLRRGGVGIAYGEIETAEYSIADAQQRMARLDRQLRSERAAAVRLVESALRVSHRGTPASVRGLIRDAQYECERGDVAERSRHFAEARRAYASSQALSDRAIRLNPRERYVEQRPVHVPAPRVSHYPSHRPVAQPVRYRGHRGGNAHRSRHAY